MKTNGNMIKYTKYISIILIIFFVLILTRCSTTIYQDEDLYSINKRDDLKNFIYFNKELSLLKIPKNLGSTNFISSCTDYDIPIIDSKWINDSNKVYKNLSIRPPILFQKDVHSDYNREFQSD